MTESPGNIAGDQAPSLEELAKRLLDLWQDQLGAAAANPDLASQAARLMAAMPLPGMWLGQMGQMGLHSAGANPGPYSAGGSDIAKSWAELARNWMNTVNQKGPDHAGGTPDHAAATKAGPATAAAASQPGGLDMDELRARLAGLEERLAELGGGKPKRKPATKSATAKRSGARPARPRNAKAGTGDSGGGSPPPDDGAAG